MDNGSTWNATYNALGQQVEKLASTWRMEVLFDPFGKELGTFDGINGLWWQRNITLGTRSTAIYLNNIVRFIHANHLGTTTFVSNGSGACLQDQRFYPWGQQWDSACGQTDLHFASLEQIDSSTGLYPTRFRQYYPRFYRWLTPDPLGGDISNPQSLNRHAYAGGAYIVFHVCARKNEARRLPLGAHTYKAMYALPAQQGPPCDLGTGACAPWGIEVTDIPQGAVTVGLAHDHPGTGFGAYDFSPGTDIDTYVQNGYYGFVATQPAGRVLMWDPNRYSNWFTPGAPHPVCALQGPAMGVPSCH